MDIFGGIIGLKMTSLDDVFISGKFMTRRWRHCWKMWLQNDILFWSVCNLEKYWSLPSPNKDVIRYDFARHCPSINWPEIDVCFGLMCFACYLVHSMTTWSTGQCNYQKGRHLKTTLKYWSLSSPKNYVIILPFKSGQFLAL